MAKQEKGDAVVEPLQRALNKDANIAIVALFAAMVAAWGYWFVFRKLPFGGPDAWASFGDYFGGIVNPIVGIVTVLLVVRTLHTTRQEAKDTRDKLEEQLSQTERQIVLSEMHKRLEGLYLEWLRLCELPAQHAVRLDGANVYEDGSAKTARDFLYSEISQREVAAIAAKWGGEGYYPRAWKAAYEGQANLLREYAIYCRQYEQAAGNAVLADYYRRRVVFAAITLNAMAVLSEREMDSMVPSPLN